MMTRRCLSLSGALAILLGMAPGARAGWRGYIETVPASGVTIGLKAPVNTPPAEGAMPCFITIINGSGAARTWDITVSSPSMYGAGSGNGNSIVQSVRVENQGTARVPILMPFDPSGGRTYRQNVIEVAGPGVAHAIDRASMSSTGPHDHQPYIAMGDAMATPLWEPLLKARKDAGSELNGSPLDLEYLGTDWRGLTGYDSIWLTGAEYTALDPDRRRAIRDWVDRGGKLFLFALSLDPAMRGELGLAAGASQHAAGFGSVTLIAHNGESLTPEEATRILADIHPLHDETRALDASLWKMTARQGGIYFNGFFLVGFITIFAAAVGPVNLFWIAGPRRRHRLFWTTPLISLGASLVLIAVILVQDGTGGRGSRLLVMRLFPEQKKAVLVQEQVSRTGVLLSRHFTLSEDALLSTIAIGPNGGRELDQAGRDYGGDWFASRSIQAHRIEAIVPSRAEVQLVNAEAAKQGAPPELVSSIPATLKEIRYVDAESRHWSGAGLRTGERVTLQRDTRHGPLSFGGEGSAFLEELQSRTRDELGSFYAVADDGPFLATLTSIRWTNQPVIYLGPVTEAP